MISIGRSTRIYFRDFLKKYIENGGDISKVLFKSGDLMHDYQIQELSAGRLVCLRMTAGIPVAGRIARFSWDRRGSSTIHDDFVVRKVEKRSLGKGVINPLHIMVTVAKAY